MFRLLFQKVLSLSKYRIVLIVLEKDDDERVVVDVHSESQQRQHSAWNRLQRAVRSLPQSASLQVVTELAEWEQMREESDDFSRVEKGVAYILANESSTTVGLIRESSTYGLISNYPGVGDVIATATKKLFG